MKKFIWLIALLSPVVSKAQIISTYAGTGSSVFSGDSGPAIAAGITNPTFGIFDKHGDYIFSDYNAKRIRKINPSGIISTIVGNGTGVYTGDGSMALATGIDRPHSVKVDTLGNLYIVQHNNNVIRKVDILTGIITTIAGDGTGAFGGDGGPATAASLWNPQDVAIDRWGNMYIADMYNYRVHKVDATGMITTVAGTGTMAFSGDFGPATDAELALPGGLAVDNTGNLYIADASSFSCRVRKVSTSGIITTIAGNGISTYIGDGIRATSAAMTPYTVALDGSDNVYISDRYNHRAYKVDAATGIFYCIAGNGIAGDGGDGGSATSANLYAPTGIAVDKCDNVYIPTIGDITISGTGRRIRKVTFNPTSVSTVSITVTPNDTVCAGTPVNYTATTTGGSTMSFKWYKNGVVVPGATSESYTYTTTTTEDADSVRCVYTGVDICSFTGNPSSNTIKMVVTPLTPPTISLASVPASTAAIGSVVTVNATVGSAGGSYSIQWYKNSVLFATTSTATTTFTKGTGADVITAKVSSTAATGCYDTTTSAGHTVSVASASVHNVVPDFVVSIYPNPVHNELYIQGAVSYYRILEIVGTVVQQGAVQGPGISVSALPAGMYLLEATGAEGQRAVMGFRRE